MGKCPRCKARVFVKLYCSECFEKEIQELDEKIKSAEPMQQTPGLPWALDALLSTFKPTIYKMNNEKIGESWISYSPNIRNPFWTLYHLIQPLLVILILGGVIGGSIWLVGLLL